MPYRKQDWASQTKIPKSSMIAMDDQIADNDSRITSHTTRLTAVEATASEANTKATTANTTISGIVNGTTPAGNATKLNGKPASDYATTATVTALADDVDRHAFGEQSGSRNLWDELTELGGFNTQGAEADSDSLIRTASYIEVNPSTAYYVVSSANVSMHYYDANKGYISNGTVTANSSFTTPSNAKYIRFRWATSYGIVYKHDTAIIEGTSGTYEPYIASNAQLTESADESEVRDAELRVLGWCVPSEMPIKNSLANGVLTQRVQRIDGSTLNWTKGDNGYYWIVSAELATSAKRDGAYFTHCYCNGNSVTALVVPTNTVRIYTDSIPKYIYYELATPITHNITDMPSQKSMISDEWDSAKTYSVGAYAIYQNQLYKCLIQHSGQNPSTATSYWKKVNVTDELMSSIKRITSLDELFGYTGLFSCNENIAFGSYTLGKYSTGLSVFFGSNDGTLTATNWTDRKTYTAICGSRSWSGYRTI